MVEEKAAAMSDLDLLAGLALAVIGDNGRRAAAQSVEIQPW